MKLTPNRNNVEILGLEDKWFLIGGAIIQDDIGWKEEWRVRGRDELGGSREVVFVPGDVVITCGQPRLLNFLDPFGTDADWMVVYTPLLDDSLFASHIYSGDHFHRSFMVLSDIERALI